MKPSPAWLKPGILPLNTFKVTRVYSWRNRSAILDEISGRAHMGSDPMNPRFMFTAKLEVKYRRNVPIGKQLKIVGKAGKSKARSAEAWAGIYEAETGELLAEGNVLLMNVPPEQFEKSRLDELGWKVYPE